MRYSLDQADFTIRSNQPHVTKISYNMNQIVFGLYGIFYNMAHCICKANTEAKFLILFQVKTLVLPWLTANLIKLHSLVLELHRGDNDLLLG